MREVENKLLGVETNVTNWQRRQNSNQNFSAVVPYDLEQQRKETREMLDDLTTRDQRMLFAVVTLVHLADSKEELDSDTETLQSIARKHLCQLAKLSFQQQDGLITALPLGLRRIDALRTLTTEALAVLMPFKAQEIRHRHGIYYGQNAISKNLILADRKELLNGNGFILGVSGSSKSFADKREITEIALSTNDDIIIIDPEAEYRPLVEGLGGEVIEISATSPKHWQKQPRSMWSNPANITWQVGCRLGTRCMRSQTCAKRPRATTRVISITMSSRVWAIFR